MGLGQRLCSRSGRLSAAGLFGSNCVGSGVEYRRGYTTPDPPRPCRKFLTALRRPGPGTSDRNLDWEPCLELGREQGWAIEPAAFCAGGAGWGRSEHWNVDTLIPLARLARKLLLPHVPCEGRTYAQPKAPRRSVIGPKRALEANTKKSCAERNGRSFRASLRAQDLSRGALKARPHSASLRKPPAQFMLDWPFLCRCEGPTPAGNSLEKPHAHPLIAPRCAASKPYSSYSSGGPPASALTPARLQPRNRRSARCCAGAMRATCAWGWKS